MTKITIDYQDGVKAEYTVPDPIADAIDSLLLGYHHTVIELGERQEGADRWRSMS